MPNFSEDRAEVVTREAYLEYANLTREQFAEYVRAFGGAKLAPTLTKRELFAIHMMAARRSNPSRDNTDDETLAQMSVKGADLLIAELAK